MFNISKNTIWFLIIFASICCMFFLFTSNNSSNCKLNRKHNTYKSSFSSKTKLIPIIIGYSPKNNETSETIRKKISRNQTESKKIFISPKNKNTDISIKKITKQLENKLINNKNIKKQYVNNEKDKYIPQKTIQQKTTPKKTTPKKTTPKKTTPQKPTLRLFFSDNCGHCVEFKPTWYALKQKYGNKINFIEINCTYNNPGLEYVQYLPTISIYDRTDKYIENYENDRSKYVFEQFVNFIYNKI
jgi:thiol-disulfide isomerase/thioredoxin